MEIRTKTELLRIEIPNRGYSVEVIPDDEKFKGERIVILGNYSKSNYMATAIVSKYGVAPTVRENHGQVTAILVEK